MSMVAGFRKVRVFKNVTEAEIDLHGSFVFIEVTNAGATEVDFLVNDFEEFGHRGTAIPIPPNQTRKIPMAVYKFKATGAVTVVAYGM